jgi:hypothetical protein
MNERVGLRATVALTALAIESMRGNCIDFLSESNPSPPSDDGEVPGVTNRSQVPDLVVWVRGPSWAYYQERNANEESQRRYLGMTGTTVEMRIF